MLLISSCQIARHQQKIGQEKQIGEKSGFIFLDFPNEIHPMPVKTPNLRKIEKFKKRSEKMVLRHCCCRVAFLRGPLIRFLRFYLILFQTRNTSAAGRSEYSTSGLAPSGSAVFLILVAAIGARFVARPASAEALPPKDYHQPQQQYEHEHQHQRPS